MPARFYRPNTPHIIHETIEGEVILVNLQNGSYYSTDQTGTYIWNNLENGVSTERLGDLAVNEFCGDPDRIRDGVDNWLEQLEREGLVVPAETPPDTFTASNIPGSNGEKTEFVPPKLLKYTEMEDLLLLDPIHDVDDSGWPRQPPETPAT